MSALAPVSLVSLAQAVQLEVVVVLLSSLHREEELAVVVAELLLEGVGGLGSLVAIQCYEEVG